jgi:hypothetical protein
MKNTCLLNKNLSTRTLFLAWKEILLMVRNNISTNTGKWKTLHYSDVPIEIASKAFLMGFLLLGENKVVQFCVNEVA